MLLQLYCLCGTSVTLIIHKFNNNKNTNNNDNMQKTYHGVNEQSLPVAKFSGGGGEGVVKRQN